MCWISEDVMPLYDYDCSTCGPFRYWGSLATAAEAHNERSANEPKVVQHVGNMGHSHGKDGHKHHAHQHARKQIKSARRPWMVGH